MPIDPIQLTRQLVDIESTTYHEAPAGEFLAGCLASLGWEITRQPVPQPDPARTPGGGSAGPRFNVYAAQKGITPDVVLSTHMDTVPPFLGPCTRGRRLPLRPRHPATPKASSPPRSPPPKNSAMPKRQSRPALRRRRRARLRRRQGRQRSIPVGSRFLINGEPTDNRLALASKGCTPRRALRPRQAWPTPPIQSWATSAIDKLLEARCMTSRRSQLPIEPKASATATLNVGILSGGRAPNVIADKAEAHILVRTRRPLRSHPRKKRSSTPPPAAADVDLLPRTPLRPACASPPRQSAHHGRQVHHGHPLTHRLGRTLPPRPRQHPRRPHPGREGQPRRSSSPALTCMLILRRNSWGEERFSVGDTSDHQLPRREWNSAPRSISTLA
jgi:acetylornithine deacetylase